MDILIEVRGVRRCSGGHTCSINVNGRRAAFVAPGILEWTNFSKKTDVLLWFSKKKNLKIPHLSPVALGKGWESQVPDHKMQDAKDQATETLLLEWISLHFQAYEIKQRCKYTVMTINDKGQIFDWRISPGASSYGLERSIATDQVLNEMSEEQIILLLEATQELATQQTTQQTSQQQ